MRTWITSALRDLAYAAAVLAWSVVGFTVLVAGVSVTASLLVLVVGVLVWLGFALLVRVTTRVDRRLAGWRSGSPVPARYRRPGERGLVAFGRTVTTDPQTWRDLGWLAANSAAGFALGLAAVTAAGVALTYLTMPLWYWAIGDPAAHTGLTDLGAFVVDSPGEALLVGAAGLLLVPVALAVARACAAAHAALAVRLLAPEPARAA